MVQLKKSFLELVPLWTGQSIGSERMTPSVSVMELAEMDTAASQNQTWGRHPGAERSL